LASLLIHHGICLYRHENDFHFGLGFRSHSQPPKSLEPRVGADLEPELVHVKIVCGILIEHVNHHVRESCNHGYLVVWRMDKSQVHLSGRSRSILLQSCELDPRQSSSGTSRPYRLSKQQGMSLSGGMIARGITM